MFRLDPSLPKSRGVEAAIRTAILDGALPPGARLPSTRDLAAELGVARNTVVSAIEELTAEGVLRARARNGTFVARDLPTPIGPPRPSGTRPAEFDLRPGHPEQDSFPTARWLAATRRAAAATPMRRNPSGGAGADQLRAQLASYLARARGVTTTPDSIVICSGFRGACTVLAAALSLAGVSTIGIEDPSLPQIDFPWRGAGFAVHDIPVDEAGAVVEHVGEVGVVLVTPSHQFPLGGALSPTRRHQLCDWARRGDRYIIEDDYDGEFRYDRRPVAALQRSAPECVIYVGSTSKTLDPALRIGWLVLPPDLVEPVVAASDALTGGAPLLPQLALAELIARGDYERHIRHQRREYARRRVHVREAMRSIGIDLSGLDAGLHAVIPLMPPAPPVVDDDEGGSASIAVHGLARYTRSAERPAALVAGFGTPARTRFRPAIAALVDFLTGSDPLTT
jgi:GntR family transcriptional regulator/MocR family aminotransferase